MSNGKAETRRNDVDIIRDNDISRRQLNGLTRRVRSGISSTSLGGGGGTSGSTGGGGSVLGDNLGNHTATQILDMSGFLIDDYGGWFSSDGKNDTIFSGGIQHNLNQFQSYTWKINGDYLMELDELGLIFGDMYYGIDLSQNQLKFEERPTPGAPDSTHRLVFMDNTLHQLAFKNDSGFVLSLEKEFMTINCIIDGGGSIITTGSKGGVWVDQNAEIISWKISDDSESGSIVVKVNRCTYLNFPIMTGMSSVSSHPTLSGGQKATGTTTGQWSQTSILNGDYINFNVSSVTTCKRVVVSLKCRRYT